MYKRFFGDEIEVAVVQICVGGPMPPGRTCEGRLQKTSYQTRFSLCDRSCNLLSERLVRRCAH
jgi:hypothetical protein